ncbi:MAG: TatD family hydrolase, partial [Alphaproteobacteria bacterium]|nr:TatD family hydrolase [Alphaproteobacteria bacterium]
MFLVDSHCHLDFRDFEDELDEVVERAHEAGVGTMVTICTHLSRFDRVRAIAERYDNIWCSAGVHPHEADSEGEAATVEALVALAADPLVVGIGETGLDFYYEHSSRDRQVTSFRNHITAARETGLPLIVHTRDADKETVDILTEEYANGPFTGLIHCFSTSSYMAEKALEIGFYISLSGIITFKAAEELRETVRGLPLDRLLVETDAPYLAPVPKRGKRNEPSFVAHTGAMLAELKQIDMEEVARVTTANFFQIFSKAERPT